MTAPARDTVDAPPSVVDAFACDVSVVARALTVDPAHGLPEDEAVLRRGSARGQLGADRATPLARALRAGRAA